MKLNGDEKDKLLKAIEDRRREKGLSITDLSELSGVEQSQTSRICAGRFVSLSGNVMQICITLGFQVDGGGALLSNALAAKLASLWDGTTEDETRLLKLLEALAAFRPATV